MPFKKDKTVLILLITILIFFSSYIWNFINIPFRDDEILGEYSVNNHHSLNDSLRYLVFILIPITGYLLFKLLIVFIKNVDLPANIGPITICKCAIIK